MVDLWLWVFGVLIAGLVASLAYDAFVGFVDELTDETRRYNRED